MTKVGWIGTGVLGTAVVKRLLNQQFDVTVFNRTTEKARPVCDEGATLADSPRSLAQTCNPIFLCLSNHEAVESVIFNRSWGIVAAHQAGIDIIDISTLNPDAACSLHSRTATVNLHYLEAPVSGGPENARLGRLSCLVAGAGDLFMRQREVLSAFTTSLHYIGPPGHAQLLKVINNLAESINLLAAAEVLTIALRAGMDLETLTNVLPTLRGYSVYMGVLLERLAHPREEISFALAMRLKDLKLAHQVAEGYAVPVPLGGLTEQLFALAVQQEGPRSDQTAAIRLYQPRT